MCRRSGCDAAEDECVVWVPGPVLGAVEHPAGGDGVGARLGLVSVVDVARGGPAVVTNQPTCIIKESSGKKNKLLRHFFS